MIIIKRMVTFVIVSQHPNTLEPENGGTTMAVVPKWYMPYFCEAGSVHFNHILIVLFWIHCGGCCIKNCHCPNTWPYCSCLCVWLDLHVCICTRICFWVASVAICVHASGHATLKSLCVHTCVCERGCVSQLLQAVVLLLWEHGIASLRTRVWVGLCGRGLVLCWIMTSQPGQDCCYCH